MSRLTFKRSSVHSPLLKALLLGHREDLEALLGVPLGRKNKYPAISPWYAQGSNGFTRTVLTYLAFRRFNAHSYPKVESCNGNREDQAQRRFWEDIPESTLTDALAELHKFSLYQNEQLSPFQDENGNLSCYRSYSCVQAHWIYQLLEDAKSRKINEIKVPTWALHSFNLEGASTYGLSPQRFVRIKVNIPIEDVFISTYSLAYDDDELGEGNYHLDKELIVFNRSPDGLFRLPISCISVHESPDYKWNYNPPKYFIRDSSDELSYLFSPALAHYRYLHERMCQPRVNLFRGIGEWLDECLYRLWRLFLKIFSR
jgi:hypothetical protein